MITQIYRDEFLFDYFQYLYYNTCCVTNNCTQENKGYIILFIYGYILKKFCCL